jgi:hypothetical protein
MRNQDGKKNYVTTLGDQESKNCGVTYKQNLDSNKNGAE